MKVTKTYSIEESLYNTFDSLTTEKNINKSSFFEDAIKKYIKDNDLDAINKQYVSKSDPNNIVTVITQDQTYYILDDGSKIQRILFLHLFKPFNGVDPNKFFNSDNTVYNNIIEKLKEIDTSDIVDDCSPVPSHKILDYKTLGVFNLTEDPIEIEPIDITNKIWKYIEEKEKKEKEEKDLNEVDPDVFFKENTVLKEIIDNIKENDNFDNLNWNKIEERKIKNEKSEISDTVDFIFKKGKYNDEKSDEEKNFEEEKLEEDELIEKYYNDYLVGGFITKTKSEIVEIIGNLSKCGDYHKRKFELLDIIKKYYYKF